MARDLLVPVRVRRLPTVRERGRPRALVAQRVFGRQSTPRRDRALRGPRRGARSATSRASARRPRSRRPCREVWRRYPRVREDYVAVVDVDSLAPVRRVAGHVLVAVAARVGRARLIDNFEWRPR